MSSSNQRPANRDSVQFCDEPYPIIAKSLRYLHQNPVHCVHASCDLIPCVPGQHRGTSHQRSWGNRRSQRGVLYLPERQSFSTRSITPWHMLVVLTDAVVGDTD